MSSILKRPGWANYDVLTKNDVLTEKIKIGDIESVIPGWGPGKEAKKYFAGKIGEEVPTGRYGAMRKVGGTSYREAELAFSRYLASSLEIAENVIATKEVKEILRGVTEEILQQKGFDDLNDWIEGWKNFAQEQFGLDLTNVATKRAVREIAQRAEDQIEQNDAAAGGDQGEEVFRAEEAPGEQEMTEEIKSSISNSPLEVQFADVSDDDATYTKISFMNQSGDKLVFVRLSDVPKDEQHKNALKNVDKGSDILDNSLLSKYITQIEIEQNGSSTFYKHTASHAESEPEPGDVQPEEPDAGDEDEFTFDLDESKKLSLKKQTILAEQVRVARKQHMQRVEERYRYY